MICNKTANSNGDLTIEILKEVIFPEIGIYEGNMGGVLVDDFKGYSKDIVKDFTISFKSEGMNENRERYNLCGFEIMSGGITPKAQPIDAFIGKVFKGHYRDYYDMYMLSASLNNKQHPIAPSRQLCAEWVVQAWKKLPERLVQKAWTVCGYKSMDDLQNVESSINHIITDLDRATTVQIMESAGGSDVILHLDDPENVIGDELDTEEYKEGTWDLVSK